MGRYQGVEDAFVVHKSQPLKGTVRINGSKNAVFAHYGGFAVIDRI